MKANGQCTTAYTPSVLSAAQHGIRGKQTIVAQSKPRSRISELEGTLSGSNEPAHFSHEYMKTRDEDFPSGHWLVLHGLDQLHHSVLCIQLWKAENLGLTPALS